MYQLHNSIIGDWKNHFFYLYFFHCCSADLCHNLFQTDSENVCIGASLVMDQLEDVISHKKLTKRNSTNFQQDQDQNNFDTLSTTTTKDDCLENRLCPKSNDVSITLKLASVTSRIIIFHYI